MSRQSKFDRRMNRIKISPLATAASKTRLNETAKAISFDHFDKLAIRSKVDISSFVPMHYEKNYAYPLVVWLHSDGASSSELNDIMPQTSTRNFVGIAPQAPVGNFEAGYFWEQELDSIDMAHDSVMAAVESATERFNIRPSRIFIAGAGAGGTMAFRIALERPDVFAGVISVNGPMPKADKPLIHWAESRDVPVFWAHSRKSKDFDQTVLCEQLRLLHIAGFSVTLRQYPGKNCLIAKTLSDVNSWIMETIDSAVS